MKTALLLLLALAVSGCVADADTPSATLEPVDPQDTGMPVIEPNRPFMQWVELVRESDPSVGELYYAYYDSGRSRPWFLSTAASAQVLQYMLRTGDTARATAIGDALLAWQHDGSGVHGDRVKGAFPSEIARDATTGGFTAQYLYDTGDSLQVCEAMLDLFDATHEQRFLVAATGVGVWLRDVMAHGEHYGVWLAPLGAPMKAVTSAGNFDNRIAVGGMLFWLPTLKRLSARTGDTSFAALAATTFAFLRQGQAPNGAIYDHYDPGYPAQPFSQTRFMAYQPGAVVADDSIRAAIGLDVGGDTAAVERFLGWLRHQRAGIPGYLDVSTGGGFFPSNTTPYDDVVASGLYARLAARVGNGDASAALAFVMSKQASNGGWFWGARQDDGTQINSDQATITGLSGLMDLSPLSI